MGKRGPRPEPTALKLLKGNPGKRKIHLDEPKPKVLDGRSIQCPKWMPPAGRKEWKRIVPELLRVGLVTEVDVGSLEGYCNAYARALQADALVKEAGLTMVTDKGFILPHPAVAMARNAWNQAKQFGAQFGLSPSARVGMHVTAPPAKQDPEKGFLFGAKRARGA